ncbi:MAG: hypothetical protein ACI9FN_000355 [Saprospiraceae bacterium]|jgi:hypothetical protein
MLVVETISDGTKMAQTQTRELRWAMSGIKRRFVLARLPLISSLIPRSMLSYVGSNLPVNGMIVHGGGPMHCAGTIDESKCCINPLTLDPNDPDFIAKTSGGLRYIDDETFVPAHPDRIIGNFTAANRFLTNVSNDFIGANFDRAIFPNKTSSDKIEAYLKTVRECDKLDGKIILEQRATFAFRSKDCKDPNDWRERVTDTIHCIMFFEWGVQGQKFTGAILGGTGKYAGASGEFHRERLLAPNFAGAETFRIIFPGLEVPDYYP